MSYRYGNVSGTGGWLAFFIATLVLGVVVALATALFLFVGASAAQVASVFRESAYARTLATLALLRGAIYAAVAWRLQFSRERNTPRFAIAGLWLAALGLGVGNLAAAIFWLRVPVGELSASLGRGLVQSLGYAVIWTAYLLRSTRVANTYGVDPDLVAAFE